MKRFLCGFLITLSFSGTVYAAGVYPVSVETVQNRKQEEIHKVYELKDGETPEMIPKNDFEHNGVWYELRDILKEELPSYETKQITEPVTLESQSNKMEDILPLIPADKDVQTEDGFSGRLELDISSVKIESKGTGRSNYQKSVTRTYPNLAGADLQYIPKTTVEGGSTLQFSSVEWQSDNTANVDDYAITDRFTAIVTYSGTGTRSYSKGYIVTAEYKGTVSKTSMDITRYTAVFRSGEPVVIGNPPVDWRQILVISGGILAVPIVLAAVWFVKQRGARKHENDDMEQAEADADDGGGIGGGNDDSYPGVRP